MQTTHHAILGHTFIILHKVYIAHFFFELSLRKTFKEITTSITKYLWLNDIHAFYRRLYNFHNQSKFALPVSFTSSITFNRY